MDTYVLIISNKYCNFSLSEYVSMYFRFTKKELIREVEYKIGALLWKLTSALLGKCKKVWYYEKWVGRPVSFPPRRSVKTHLSTNLWLAHVHS